MTILVDIDGVLREGKDLLPNAAEFIDYIKSKHKVCLLSNSTFFKGETIRTFFQDHQIDLGNISIQTALDVAIAYAAQNYQTYNVYASKDGLAAFNHTNVLNPQACFVGDLKTAWTYEICTEIFNHVMNGADLVALHKNRFGKGVNGLTLDAGAFISGIEYSSGKKATLLGKPNKVFFESGIELCKGSTPFVMVGDDLKGDIEGAQLAGGRSILVLTGKTNQAILAASTIQPDAFAEDLSGVINILEQWENTL